MTTCVLHFEILLARHAARGSEISLGQTLPALTVVLLHADVHCAMLSRYPQAVIRVSELVGLGCLG